MEWKRILIHCIQPFHLPFLISVRYSVTNISLPLSLSFIFSPIPLSFSRGQKEWALGGEGKKRWEKWSMHVKAKLMSSAKTWFYQDALRLSSSPWINWFFANFQSDSRGVGREWGGTWQMKTEVKTKEKRNKTNGLFSFLCLWGRENNQRKWEMWQTLNDSQNRPGMTNDTS